MRCDKSHYSDEQCEDCAGPEAERAERVGTEATRLRDVPDVQYGRKPSRRAADGLPEGVLHIPRGWNAPDVRCDWKSWCVLLDGHDGDCLPSPPSRLIAPATPLDVAKVLAVPCGRCRASASVSCAGSVGDERRFHFARFCLANVDPLDGVETVDEPVPAPLRDWAARGLAVLLAVRPPHRSSCLCVACEFLSEYDAAHPTAHAPGRSAK